MCMFYFQNESRLEGSFQQWLSKERLSNPFPPKNSYKAGQNWQHSPPPLPESTISASWKWTRSRQQSEEGLCLRNGWTSGLKWWESVSLNLALLPRPAQPCPQGGPAQPVQAVTGEKGLTQIRVVGSSLGWSDSFEDEHVGRDSGCVSPRLQAYLGQERKTVWRKNPQKCIWGEAYPGSSTNLK